MRSALTASLYDEDHAQEASDHRTFKGLVPKRMSV